MENRKTIVITYPYSSRWSILLLASFLLLFAGYRSCSTKAFTASSNRATSDPSPKKPSGEGSEIGVIKTIALTQAPKYVRRVINHLKAVKDLKPISGFKGGKVFRNIEGRLPKGKTYYEFDVHPFTKGVSRGPERLVVDQQKSVFYYTKDHYNTFVQIK